MIEFKTPDGFWRNRYEVKKEVRELEARLDKAVELFNLQREYPSQIITEIDDFLEDVKGDKPK